MASISPTTFLCCPLTHLLYFISLSRLSLMNNKSARGTCDRTLTGTAPAATAAATTHYGWQNICQLIRRGSAVPPLSPLLLRHIFSLVFYVAHAIFCFCVWMILKSSLCVLFFSIFQRCFFCVFAFCLPAVTELTFHFYFRIVFFCFILLLAHFLISHGSLVKLVKTATEDLIKSGISLINISASDPGCRQHRRVEVQVTSGRMLSFG